MAQYLNITKVGSNICVRGIDESGSRYSEKVPYKPYSFVESNADTEYRSMFGKPLKRIDHDSMSDQWQFKKNCQAQDINLYGMDDNICQFMTDQYNNEYNTDNVRVFWLDIENLMTDKHGNKFGIDPLGAHGALTAITIYNTSDKTFHVFGDGVWKNNDYKHRKVKYYHCEDELDLARQFLKFWRENYPDIVTGWHSNGYDIPYLVNRLTQLLGESMAKKLSPWNKVTSREYKSLFGKVQTEYKLYGISCVDYIDIYKKNKFHKQESYKLDFIAKTEIKKGKLDYHDEGYKDLDDLYNRNYQRYIDYNIRDVESLIDIDDKNKFVNIVIGIAHYAIVNYDEVYSVLRCWDSIRHRYLKERNVISSPKSRNEKDDKFTGAYVKEPVPALYKWIITFDLKALYPSIIMTCNIGDETIVDPSELPNSLLELYNRDISRLILDGKITDKQQQALKDNNLTMAANGTFYHNEEHSVQSILSDDILVKRRVYKDAMLKYKEEYERAVDAGADEAELKRLKDLITYNKNQQLVVKVLANSLYGAMGNQYDRYFDLKLAEGVTLTGQTIIKWAEQKVNEYLDDILGTKGVTYCIYSDTDSIFINLEPLVNKMGSGIGDDREKTVEFLDKVGDQINKKLTEYYSELADILNSKNNRMDMKREVISSSSIFRSKKNYAMTVWDNEGVRYTKPDYKIMGIEVVRSTTPKFIKDRVRKALIMMLSDCERTELIDYIAEVREEYMAKTIKDIEDISFPKGTNDILKWIGDDSDNNVGSLVASETSLAKAYAKGVPFHVRGTLLFNKYYANEENIITGGDSIRYLYLKVPNPMNENVISFVDGIPPDLWEYVDWTINFQKIFLNPVKSLADVIGWSLNNNVSLADLLG